MRRVIFILTLILFSSLKTEDYVSGCIQLEILLVADLSDSVNGSEPFIHDAASAFINKFDLAEDGIRIGVITFSGVGNVVCPLTHKKDTLNKAIDRYIAPRSANGSTNYQYALTLVLNEFYYHARPNVMRMVIMITDGEPNNCCKGEDEATLIKTSPGTLLWGIFVEKTIRQQDPDNPYQYPYYSMPSNNRGGKDFLKSIVSPNCYVETDYNNLVNEIKKLDICL